MFYGANHNPSLGLRRPKKMIKVKITEGDQQKSIRRIIENTRNQMNVTIDKQNKISLRKESERFSQINSNDKKIVRFSQIYQQVLQPINRQNLPLRSQPRNSTKIVRQEPDNFLMQDSSLCQRPYIQKVALVGGLNNIRVSQSDFNIYQQKYSVNSSSRMNARISDQMDRKLFTQRGNNYHINLSKKRMQKMKSINGTNKIKTLRQSLVQPLKVPNYQTRSIKGTKQINQDTIKVGDGVWIVCDGHGQYGHDVSWYAANMLYELYHEKISKQKFSKGLLKQIFVEVERGLQQSGIDINLSGSTCVMVVQIQSKIYCACLGDSVSIAIYQNQQYQIISSEHKPCNFGEAQRIQFFGGIVKKTNGKQHLITSPLRLWGQGQDQWGPGLAISRSFGDKMAQKYGLIYQPQIKQIQVDPSLRFIVLGSDGLFDQVKPSEMASILSIPGTRAEGCRLLTEMAQSRWIGYSDDISGVVIYL